MKKKERVKKAGQGAGTRGKIIRGDFSAGGARTGKEDEAAFDRPSNVFPMKPRPEDQDETKG